MSGHKRKDLTLRLVNLLLASCLIVVACTPPPAAGPDPSGGTGRTASAFPFDWEFRGREPTGVGQNGMVVTADVRATRVGLDVLRSGGNAVDAAVAVGFALAVVLPSAGNIGGGGFMVSRMANGESAALDFREKAPLALLPGHFIDENGRPSNASLNGHLSVGVPGTVAGLAEAHRRHGSQPWADLLAPAIDLAQNGFTFTERMNQSLASRAQRLMEYETTQQIFFPGGAPPRVGSTFRQPLLAQTLRLIAQEGKDAFYRGRTADLIVREMAAGGGLISHEDLSRYRAVWRDPIMFDYRGYTIISMPPPSSGGIALAEILNVLEGYNIRRSGWHTVETIHLMTESFRRAFADRNYYLGDPDFVEMPVERLTSDEYARELRTTIARSRASSSEQFNRVPVSEGTNTTHYSIVDAQGNAVALSYTINSAYGSGVVVRGAGFFLNNEMDDFTVRVGYANQFGLVQSESNLVAPERRPLSAMAPTIVVDSAGQLRLVLGSPGGPKIITAVAQVIMNVVDHGMGVRSAVDAPRVHHQLLPDELQFETRGVHSVVLGTLGQMGHEIYPGRGHFGAVQAILRAPDGTLYGANDPRRSGGRALGY